MTPAQRNRAAAQKPYPGRVLIATCANREYLAYAPLFKYCARKAYPEYAATVSTVPDFLHPYAAATMRFTEPPFEEIAALHDYTLIADIDILMFREKVLPHVQYCRLMEQYGLGCYCNYVLDDIQCPGVHFVARDWWERTREIRHEQQRFLVELHQREIAELKRGYDERVLLQILRASGLPEPPHRALPLGCHGIHLGKWTRVRKGQAVQADPSESAAAKAFLEDGEFMALAEKVPGVVEILEKIGGK